MNKCPLIGLLLMAYQQKNRWTARQVNYLIENWDTKKDTDIAETLGKTLKSVRRKRERLELKKASGRGVVARMPEKEAKEVKTVKVVTQPPATADTNG